MDKHALILLVASKNLGLGQAKLPEIEECIEYTKAGLGAQKLILLGIHRVDQV